jgi:predicted nucleotidyltransferase
MLYSFGQQPDPAAQTRRTAPNPAWSEIGRDGPNRRQPPVYAAFSATARAVLLSGKSRFDSWRGHFARKSRQTSRVTDIRPSSLLSVGVIQELAADLDVEERTLRRAVAQGALRASRTGPRRLQLAPGEREYLCTHWSLLSELRQMLRTEHQVRLAVLYGSLARGDEDAGSDLDLLISLADDRPLAGSRLATRLQSVSGRQVDVANLGRVEVQAPLLLDRVLDEGRVLIDRDGEWDRLCKHHSALRVRALRAYRLQMAGAARAIEELTA